MKLFRALIFILLPTLCLFSFAQPSESKIYFAEKEYDFGQVYEADGHLVMSFRYSNTGLSALKINRIVAPGFKVVEYTQEDIFPQKTGTLKVKMVPFNQAGYFNKSIRIFSNAVNSPSELIVKGKVLPGSYSGSFNHNIGGLALRQSQLNFGYVFKNSEMVRFIPVMNKSKEVITVHSSDLPKHIQLVPKFDALPPGKTGVIEVVFKATKLNDWDFVINKIKLQVRASQITDGTISVTANVREDFSKLSDEDKSSMPRINIPIKVFNFDTIAKNSTVSYNFLIKNTGNRVLDIRAVKPTCGCTAGLPVKNSIVPGDSTFVKVKFDSNGMQGVNKKGVTIISNDPLNYKEFLWVTGYIAP